MSDYNHIEIEKKWQKYWEQNKTFEVTEDTSFPEDRRIYCMEMFPYPSGSGLHVGHLKNYIPVDAFCRFKRMCGYNVLHPMGWDAFGQPAENEAIKKGRNPRDMVPEYANAYKQTLKLVGCSYDWSREINSSLPDYYKWTQWFFLLLHKKGLAYRMNTPINWCPSCKTGLANEEVKEGKCWRCDTIVEKKPMMQWFFKITDYAERLLKDLDDLNWSNGMKDMQRDWIGRSEGALIDFKVDINISNTSKNKIFRDNNNNNRCELYSANSVDSEKDSEDDKKSVTIIVFTTRPDTLWGATFLVLAPEHKLVEKLTTEDKKSEVAAYIKKIQNITEVERLSTERKKTGVFLGSYAIHPVTKKQIPIWIADYVLTGYGTGAIMAVPGQDQRDWDFAETYNLPIVRTVQTPEKFSGKAFIGDGKIINSDFLNGLSVKEGNEKIIKWLEDKKIGKYTVNFRIRDWLISRQRYWGVPIPIVYCEKCGEVGLPENHLPVLLPEVAQYMPSGTGESPLATISEYVNTTCPKCKGPAKRETDTMGGYACSSWYYYRFLDAHNTKAFADKDKIKYWMPVKLYVGGVEHARSHLLYSRFWTKVLYDEGYIDFQEPFLSLKNQGSLLAYTPGRKPKRNEGHDENSENDNIVDWIVLKPEERASFPKDQIVWRWARMSKSKGNVVTPDEMAEKYGADSLRVYLLFVAPLEDDVMWNEEGIKGSHRFVGRVWRWLITALKTYDKNWKIEMRKIDGELQKSNKLLPEDKNMRRKLHQTIQKVSNDIEHFQFNTAVAALMEFLNEMYTYSPIKIDAFECHKNPLILSEISETLLLLMAPFAPHIAEELWGEMGNASSISNSKWPLFSKEIAADDFITIVFQVNGKLRGSCEVPVDINDDDLVSKAFENENVKSFIDSKEIVKKIVVKKKLVNIVVK